MSKTITIEPKYVWSFNASIYKLMRSLERHRERYLRAWMAHYRCPSPQDVHIVTHMGGAFVYGEGSTTGEVMRMEFRQDTDPVVALVRAARTAYPILSEVSHEAAGYAQGALFRALKHFEKIP